MVTVCSTIHHWTELSYFTGISCILLTIITVPLNLILLLALTKCNLRQSKFYAILANIAFADLINGVIIDPYGVVLLIEEAVAKGPSKAETDIFHFGLFMCNTTGALSMALLYMERYISMEKPHLHNKLRGKHVVLSFACVWVSGFAAGCTNFLMGFTSYLFVYLTCTVIVAVITMVITLKSFWKRLIRVQQISQKQVGKKPLSSSVIDCQNGSQACSSKTGDTVTKTDRNKETDHDDAQLSSLSLHQVTSGNLTKPGNVDEGAAVKGCKGKHKTTDRKTSKTRQPMDRFLLRMGNYRATYYEARIIGTLLFFSILFVVGYLPVFCACMYFHFCTSCNCLVSHILRDLTIVAILSSSAIRPIIFLIRLTFVQQIAINILKGSRSPTTTRNLRFAGNWQ